MGRPVSYGPSVADWCACHVPASARVGGGRSTGGGRGYNAISVARMLHRRGWARHSGTHFDVWFALVTFGSHIPDEIPVRRGGRVIEVAHFGSWSWLRPRRRARLWAMPWLRAKLWLDKGYGQLQQWVPVDRPQMLVTVSTRLR